MRIVISEFMSLDGVVQAPGGPDGDTKALSLWSVRDDRRGAYRGYGSASAGGVAP